MSGPWGLRDSWQPASSNPGRRERKGKRKRVSNRRKKDSGKMGAILFNGLHGVTFAADRW